MAGPDAAIASAKPRAPTTCCTTMRLSTVEVAVMQMIAWATNKAI